MMPAGKTALRATVATLATFLGAAACHKAPPPELARPAAKTAAAEAAPSAAAKPTGPGASPAAKPAGPIPWMEDDLAAALARARAEKKPLFIDGWAPWCHTCLSMRSFVLSDASLAPLAARFVWLAMDTEKPTGADFLARYPMESWPTFFIVDPEGEKVAGRWVGSLSLAQLRGFLEDGERTVQLAHAGQLAPDDPLALVRAGDQAALGGKNADAASLYARAIAKAPAGWPRRTEALVGELSALRKDQPGACVDLGLAELDRLGNAPNAADFIALAVGCAEALPGADPRMDPRVDPRIEKMRRAALERLLALANDTKAPLAADDRGDIWRMVWGLREDLGDAAGAKEAASKRLALTTDAAASAPDALAASTFDWARAESLLYLGRGDEAAALLEASEAALPDDYNPPARLARVLFEQKRYGEALAAIDRALTKVQGPRKGSLLGLKADILDKQGRRADARRVAEELVAFYEGLPQKRPEALAAAKKRLERLKD